MSDREITAELTPEELNPETAPEAPEAPEVVLTLTFAAKTDLGRVRENNEDKFDWFEPDDPALLARRGRLYLVADGMGGHAAGQIAAEIALKAIGEAYYAGTRDAADEALLRSIVKANAVVYDTSRAIPSRAGMGCTIVAVAVREAEAAVAWAGDSRVYRIRGGEAERLTQDHSWVGEQVRAGVMTEAEAERSSYRNIITRCLGTEASVAPEVRREPLRAGDVLLLCSDGLTGVVPDGDIARIASSLAPSFACAELIDLANERGGPDNITVAILRVDADGVPEPEPSPAEQAATPSEPAPDTPSEDRPRRRFRFGF